MMPATIHLMLTESDFIALAVTLKLAFISTFILLLLGTPLAWWLARSQWRFKFLFETVIALPLVLPPTVLGFYLLITLGAQGIFPRSLAFTFTGLVIGSVIYSMPFVVQPLQNAFSAIGQRPLDVAATLRATPLDRFFTVALPLARPGFISAAALGFAHTLGEFGVVLMIGGNIPGKTQVASIAIYNHTEALEYSQAHGLSILLILLSFILLACVYAYKKPFRLQS